MIQIKLFSREGDEDKIIDFIKQHGSQDSGGFFLEDKIVVKYETGEKCLGFYKDAILPKKMFAEKNKTINEITLSVSNKMADYTKEVIKQVQEEKSNVQEQIDKLQAEISALDDLKKSPGATRERREQIENEKLPFTEELKARRREISLIEEKTTNLQNSLSIHQKKIEEMNTAILQCGFEIETCDAMLATIEEIWK